MEKLKMHSADKVQEHIAQIGMLFPNCITETRVDGKVVRAVDFDMLRQELSDVLVEGPAERIRRAPAWIARDYPQAKYDRGFRVLKLDTSNMKDVYYRPEEYSLDSLIEMADNIKEDRTAEDLLFQVMLDLGIALSSRIEERDIAGKTVFSVADGRLIACFDGRVSTETVKAIAQKQPAYAVFRDAGFGSDSTAANFDQIFETYSPGTIRKVL